MKRLFPRISLHLRFTLVSAALLLMASPGKVEMACQLAAVSSESQRKWVQMAVLGIDLLAVLLLAMLGMGFAQWGRAPG